MEKPATGTRIARCSCGSVTMQTEGAPIMTVACYCKSCQQAARRLESLPGAPAVSEHDHGTHFVMHRKDRLQCLQGRDQLREHRLTPRSSTRRVLATCCNSAMFLEFEGGHWLSVYKNRFDPDEQPPIDMRTMTADRPSVAPFADDVPSPKTHSLAFMWRLFAAWLAMGFKSPKIDYVRGTIDA